MSYLFPLASSSYTHYSIINNKATIASACLPSYIIKKPLGFHPSNLHNKCFSKSNASTSTLTCKALSSSTMMDFDLYDLLGIDSSCDQSQVKVAYRSLQKRCHPDIAGPAGHDMAIILNDAYAILSDPNARLAYDKVNFYSFLCFNFPQIQWFSSCGHSNWNNSSHVMMWFATHHLCFYPIQWFSIDFFSIQFNFYD